MQLDIKEKNGKKPYMLDLEFLTKCFSEYSEDDTFFDDFMNDSSLLFGDENDLINLTCKVINLYGELSDSNENLLIKVLNLCASRMEENAHKYEPMHWARVDTKVTSHDIREAIFRHWTTFTETDYDTSEENHLIAIITNIMILNKVSKIEKFRSSFLS